MAISMTAPCFEPVARLLADIYTREAMMSDAGMSSFVPGLDFVKAFCTTPDMFREYQESRINSRKLLLTRDEGLIRDLTIRKAKAQQEYNNSGNIWDLELTSYDQQVMRLRAHQPHVLENLLSEARSQADCLWRDEVSRFSAEEIAPNVPEGKCNWVALYRQLADIYLVRHGFTRDTSKESEQALSYSKKIGGPYRLCWIVDQRKLNNLEFRSSLSIWLQVRMQTEGKMSRLAKFSFEALFPFREGPINGGRYIDFESATEMKALFTIYSTMYKLIQPDLDIALCASIK